MKNLAVLFWIGALLGSSIAQSNKAAIASPDFSGTWVLDKSKSKLGEGGHGAAYISTALEISHREPELKVIRKFGRNGREQSEELTYYTDGRGESHPFAYTISGLKTKTKWDKARLTTKWTWSSDIGNDSLFTDISERRELSADKRVLNITFAITGIQGLLLLKLVFTRQP
jgi:hypothetical protein